MTDAVIVTLLLLCVAQFVVIRRIRQEEAHWREVLRRIRRGEREKIFSRRQDVMADIGYELNAIIDEKQKHIEHLQKADAANRLILTSLSHDVRTPLASLLGYLEALNTGIADSEEEKEYISVAHRKANDLKAYIDNLFEWARLNSNERQFQLETVEINEYTRELLIEWLPTFEQSRISLAANIGDDEVRVAVDRLAYKRILDNLIQNAVNHGHCTRIGIAIARRSEAAIIEVSNDGRVIPVDQLPYIFDRLYKCDSSRSDKGSGLGLAITKELVAALHGDISVTSDPEQGTVFSIVFPMQ